MTANVIARLSAVAAGVRRCLRDVERSGAVIDLTSQVVQLECDLARVADDLMVDRLRVAGERRVNPLGPRCHCGASRKPENETCGSNHCRATARNARRSIRRHERRQGEA